MRKLALLLVTLLVTGGPVAATQLSETPFEFTVPSGWTVRSWKGMKFKLCFGPVSNGFAPNMNIMEDKASMTVDKYCQTNEAVLKQKIPSLKIKGKSYFKTAKGLQGVKLVTNSNQEKRNLTQTFYMFPGKGDAKYVVTCTTLATGAAKWGPQFDKSMKTFVVK